MERRHYEVGDAIKGGYRVLSKERGFLGLVYLSRREVPGGDPEYAAIKTFRFDEEVHRALFDAELSNWVRLPPHPNVVRALDADTVEKLLVLEFVRGPNLQSVAAHSPIHPGHLLAWARQIAAGLRFLHVENHFLHRDLRPANVLIDTVHGLTAKISDLGIGKPFDPGEPSHTMIGTFNYMAPEVFEGQTDYRSDIFCYGATLYYLLTGRPAVKLSTEHLKKLTPPSEWVPCIPRAVDCLVLRCLERRPDERYQSMDQVVEALKAIPEWTLRRVPYKRCRKHSYLYCSASAKADCPFCRYARKFRESERELQRALARRSE